MIGLLKKDLYVADKSGRLLLVLALIFSMIPTMGAFGSTYAMMMAVMMPLTSIAYDERCKWDRYAAMLPYRIGQLVWSKYLLSYLYTLLGGSIIVLGAFLRGMDYGGGGLEGDGGDERPAGGRHAVHYCAGPADALPVWVRKGPACHDPLHGCRRWRRPWG